MVDIHKRAVVLVPDPSHATRNGEVGQALSSSPSPMGNIGAEDGSSLTASAIIAPAVSGSHVVKIDGYSRTKGLGNGKHIVSETFAVGGQGWCVRYYPDGWNSDNADWISIYLCCSDRTEPNEARAEFKISLLDQDRQPVPLYRYCSQIRTFSSEESAWGFARFIKRKDLEGSIYLRDDTFCIRCDVTVVQKIFTEPMPMSMVVPVPPSDMHRHLGLLLLDGEAADVTFEVGAETFSAHRCILAARSSVFKAELLGPMKEKTVTHVRIKDIEASVFKALLHFIYTDSMPVVDDGDKAAMAQHLLVAADRYAMERLKLICEGKLCSHICRNTVATTLALAEQHGCGALKEACFEFLMSPGNLKAVMASDGYEHLRASCPSVLHELVVKLAP